MQLCKYIAQAKADAAVAEANEKVAAAEAAADAAVAEAKIAFTAHIDNDVKAKLFSSTGALDALMACSRLCTQSRIAQLETFLHSLRRDIPPDQADDTDSLSQLPELLSDVAELIQTITSSLAVIECAVHTLQKIFKSKSEVAVRAADLSAANSAPDADEKAELARAAVETSDSIDICVEVVQINIKKATETTKLILNAHHALHAEIKV